MNLFHSAHQRSPEAPLTMPALMRQPSAYIPLAMSGGALVTVCIHLARLGVTHEVDEGAAVHIWQLLMAGQFPIIAYFLIRWTPEAPRPVLAVLLLQCGAALAALAPVFLLKL